jgi:hypothetical protein
MLFKHKTLLTMSSGFFSSSLFLPEGVGDKWFSTVESLSPADAIFHNFETILLESRSSGEDENISRTRSDMVEM